MKKIELKTINSFILALLPIFIYYDFPRTTINIGTTLCFVVLLLLIIEIFSKGILNSISSNVPILVFFIYVFFSIILSLLNQKSNIVSSVLVLANIVSIIIIWNKKNVIDKETFIKTYKTIAFIAIMVYCIQVIYGLIFNAIIPTKIPFLPLTESFSGIQSTIIYVNKREVIKKCCSLFSESSHFAVFLLPLIHLYINDKNSNKLKRFPLIFLISFIIVLVNSANGIIGLIILLAANLVIKYREKKVSVMKRIVTIASFFILVLVLYVFLNSIPYFNTMFSRIFTDSDNNVSKAGYRIYRGFYIINTLPIKKLLFGLGFLQISNYVTTYGISTPYDIYNNASALEYTNFVCQLILYFGLIGLAFFTIALIKFLKSLKSNQVCFFICVLALWFSSSMLFEQNFLFSMAFIISSSVYLEKEMIIKQKEPTIYDIRERKLLGN